VADVGITRTFAHCARSGRALRVLYDIPDDQPGVAEHANMMMKQQRRDTVGLAKPPSGIESEKIGFAENPILGVAAKLERRRILERAARGRTDAKAKGVKFGRKPRLTAHQQREAVRRRDVDGETLRSIGRSYIRQPADDFEAHSVTNFAEAAAIFEQHRELLKSIQQFIVNSCKIIYWHDPGGFSKSLPGGCCFIIRFPAKLVGITADHVVEAYHKAKAQAPTLACQLWNIGFELSDRIIDHDAALDIATFDLSERELSQIGGNEIDCRGSWPPPIPETGNIISIVGFPEFGRQVHRIIQPIFVRMWA
jgi:hypothetical protein